MNSRRDYLVAKVKARNLVNKELRERVPFMIEALMPFIGKQVLKVDGTLLEKVRKVLPEIPNTVAFSGWYNSRSSMEKTKPVVMEVTVSFLVKYGHRDNERIERLLEFAEKEGLKLFKDSERVLSDEEVDFMKRQNDSRLPEDV